MWKLSSLKAISSVQLSPSLRPVCNLTPMVSSLHSRRERHGVGGGLRILKLNRKRKFTRIWGYNSLCVKMKIFFSSGASLFLHQTKWADLQETKALFSLRLPLRITKGLLMMSCIHTSNSSFMPLHLTLFLVSPLKGPSFLLKSLLINFC